MRTGVFIAPRSGREHILYHTSDSMDSIGLVYPFSLGHERKRNSTRSDWLPTEITRALIGSLLK